MRNTLADSTGNHAAGDASSGPREALAAQLRGLRRSCGMTLEQVSRESGISTSFLSQVERGQVDMSITRLRTLARLFGVRAGDLLIETEAHLVPQMTLPGGGRLIERGPGVSFRVLPNAEYGVQAVHFTLEPGAAFSKPVAHKGADIIWVSSGELTLVHGLDTHLVPSGSCVSFAASVPHAYRNDGDLLCDAFGVATSSW